MPRDITIDEDTKNRFAGVYLLDHIEQETAGIPVFLDDNDEDLEPVLAWLMARDCLHIQAEPEEEKEKSLGERMQFWKKDEELPPEDQRYRLTDKGRKVLEQFRHRYREVLGVFDVFCAVDLEAGAFAMADYFDYQSNPTAWQKYLHEDRWEDLRLAAADNYGINPVEVVFLHFLSEGRFGRTQYGWQFDLLLGSVWDEIREIAANALYAEDLGFETDGEVIDGRTVLQDVLTQGLNLLLELREQEAAFDPMESMRLNGDSKAIRPRDPGIVSIGEIQKYLDPNYQSELWNQPWLV